MSYMMSTQKSKNRIFGLHFVAAWRNGCRSNCFGWINKE